MIPLKRFNNRFSSIFGLFIIFVLGLAIGYGLSLSNEKPTNLDETTTSTGVDTKSDEVEVNEPNLMDIVTPKPDSVDKEQIEDTIFQLVNELSNELGAGFVIKNENLRLAADIRAVETEESFSHTRPNGTEPFTVLEEQETFYPYFMVGENLAMATYFRGDDHMARLIFDGWVDSEEHYKTMINPDFEEIGIGVHYDGEILYATQFFGTAR